MDVGVERQAPPPKLSRFQRRRKEEADRAEAAAAWAAKPKKPRFLYDVDPMRQLRRGTHPDHSRMSARTQRRALKTNRRGREPMSRAERRKAGLQ